MPTDSNQLNFKPFGSNADNRYKPIEFGDPAIVIDPSDADAVNKIRGNTEWERGIEGNSVLTNEGIFGYTSGNIENAKFLAMDLLLSRYIYPRGTFAYSSTITYNLNSFCFDIATGIIYKSIADLHTGKALNDTDYWEDTGLTLDNYIALATATTQGSAYLTTKVNLTYNTTTSLLYSVIDNESKDEITNGTLNLATVGADGLDAGTLQINTTYHIFEIKDLTNNLVKTLASTSLASPILPSGFTKKKHIFSLITNGAGELRPMIIDKDGWVTYEGAGIQDLTAGGFINNGVTIQQPLTVPTDVKCEVQLSAYSNQQKSFWFGDGGSTFVMSNTLQGNFGFVTDSTTDNVNAQIIARTNTSREIRISSWNYAATVQAQLTIHTVSYKIII